jgi:crotonobetainyl-CoA:carnitine CoA-transferase CaiB-like acyl-CoA transferase
MSEPIAGQVRGDEAARSTQPLSGIRVLDLGQVWAGPLLGVYLSDFGAEVIRVETQVRTGMQSGAQRPLTDPANPFSYEGLGRNRRSVALNLANPDGRELFLQLVAVSDVVFDNLSPRAVKKLGIDYESLCRVNERIIVASLSAAGQNGPWADVLTYGPSLTALYGIKSLLGYAGETQLQEDIADLDPTAATYAMVAILAALRWRERTGRGQFIDMAQGEAGVAALAEAVLEYTLNGRVLGPTGNRHRTMAPHGIYPAVGDDRWIAIAVDSDAAWRALCSICGEPEAAGDQRFRDLYSRLQHQDELDDLVGRWTAGFDAEELTARLQAAGVACYPVLDALGVVADEQLSHRKGMTRVAAPELGDARLLTGTPWGLSVSPAQVHGPNRAIGADNDYVLGEILGFSKQQLAESIHNGAVG